MSGTKFDAGKEPLDLIPHEAIFGVSRVLEFGANKYSSHNWRGGMAWSRLLAATLRHLFKFMAGQDLDTETGLPHIDHAMCNLMFLSAYFHSKLGKDDRYAAPKLETPVVDRVDEPGDRGGVVVGPFSRLWEPVKPQHTGNYFSCPVCGPNDRIEDHQSDNGHEDV